MDANRRTGIEVFGIECNGAVKAGNSRFQTLIERRLRRNNCCEDKQGGKSAHTGNAHGPDEFLHIPTAKKLTVCVAQIIADHAVRPPSTEI